ncbi:MAG: hypothetical protein WC538_12605 [Thermoanaerobaculia bacterium]|jgi:hypothetical protein
MSTRGLLFGAALEAAIAVVAIVRVRAAMKAVRARGDAPDDPFELLERFVHGMIPVPAVAGALLYELRVVDWALVRRGVRVAREREGTFRWKGADEWRVVVIALSIVIAAESLALHLFLAPKIGSFVWLVTALDLYAMLWLVADCRALEANGIRVTGRGVSIRFGIRWEADVEPGAVDRVEAAANGNWDRKLALIDEPTLVIVMRRPVELRGPYGIRRRASRIGVRLEDSAAFQGALAGRLVIE